MYYVNATHGSLPVLSFPREGSNVVAQVHVGRCIVVRLPLP